MKLAVTWLGRANTARRFAADEIVRLFWVEYLELNRRMG